MEDGRNVVGDAQSSCGLGGGWGLIWTLYVQEIAIETTQRHLPQSDCPYAHPRDTRRTPLASSQPASSTYLFFGGGGIFFSIIFMISSVSVEHSRNPLHVPRFLAVFSFFPPFFSLIFYVKVFFFFFPFPASIPPLIHVKFCQIPSERKDINVSLYGVMWCCVCVFVVGIRFQKWERF